MLVINREGIDSLVKCRPLNRGESKDCPWRVVRYQFGQCRGGALTLTGAIPAGIFVSRRAFFLSGLGFFLRGRFEQAADILDQFSRQPQRPFEYPQNRVGNRVDRDD